MVEKYIFRILFAWVLLIAICALVGDIAVAESNNARATADFLNIGVSARAAGMGGAYTSIADDASAAYWNPSGLTSIDRPQLIISHFAWYQDISYEYMAIALPVGEKYSLSIGASYLNYGTIAGYDAYDNPTGDVGGTYDMSGGLSVGYRVSERLSAGLTAKYIILSLDNNKAGAVAADFGLQYSISNYVFGLALSNVGQDIKFQDEAEKLPTSVKAGVSAYLFGATVLASMELEDQFYGDMIFKNGVEFNHLQKYFLRGGLSFLSSRAVDDYTPSYSLGAGAIFGPSQFDYTFSPSESYNSESIHRFSISFKLK
jgi:hypothetical protein